MNTGTEEPFDEQHRDKTVSFSCCGEVPVGYGSDANPETVLLEPQGTAPLPVWYPAPPFPPSESSRVLGTQDRPIEGQQQHVEVQVSTGIEDDSTNPPQFSMNWHWSTAWSSQPLARLASSYELPPESLHLCVLTRRQPVGVVPKAGTHLNGTNAHIHAYC